MTLLSRRAFNASLLATGFAVSAALPRVASAQSPTAGGTLRVAWGAEPTEFVPLTTSSGSTQFVGAKLLSYDRDLNPVPNLAESWSATPDGLG